MGRAEGRQARQGYVDQRDRHQLEAERLSALARDQQRRRGREHRREQPSDIAAKYFAEVVATHAIARCGDTDREQAPPYRSRVKSTLVRSDRCSWG
jgi:hypothetical protein